MDQLILVNPDDDLAIPQSYQSLYTFIGIGALYQNSFESKYEWYFWENSVYFTILLR